jgi:S1-C subfamily serine protease
VAAAAGGILSDVTATPAVPARRSRWSPRRAALVLLVATAPFVFSVRTHEPTLADPDASASPAAFLGVLTGPDDLEVRGVFPGSPADVAGLRPGDRIREVNGVTIDNPRQLRAIVGDQRPGKRSLIRVDRQGESLVVPVVLQRRE